jgi:ferritin-like metal-binding protein YciE
MNSVKQSFEHQLKELYSAVTQSLASHQHMADAINDTALEQLFKSHLEQKKEQKSRIECICRELNLTPSGEPCKTMDGLLKETQSLRSTVGNPVARDAAFIAEAQRIERYEISAYRLAIHYAKDVGYKKTVQILQKSFDEVVALERQLMKLPKNPSRPRRPILKRIFG